MQDFQIFRQSIADELLAQAKEPVLPNIAQIIGEMNHVLSGVEIAELASEIASGMTGFGQLSPLINRDITDVLVNNFESVWTDGKHGLQKHQGIFREDAEVAILARRLAALCNMRLDDSQPFVDGLLPNGVRLHALLPPISGQAAKISLRFSSHQTIPISDWTIGLDSLGLELLASVIQGKSSFVICGETGSGKTTLLKSIIASRNQKERILILEDSPELNLDLPNVASLFARKANTEGRGEISLENLVKQSLRMRPDAIVVGEIRGREALDFLLAISSGHIGSGTTIHAQINTVVSRFQLLAGLAGVANEFSKELFYSTIDVVMQCGRTSEGRRIISIKKGLNC